MHKICLFEAMFVQPDGRLHVSQTAVVCDPVVNCM
jgi:hypothetical protein